MSDLASFGRQICYFPVISMTEKCHFLQFLRFWHFRQKRRLQPSLIPDLVLSCQIWRFWDPGNPCQEGSRGPSRALPGCLRRALEGPPGPPQTLLEGPGGPSRTRISGSWSGGIPGWPVASQGGQSLDLSYPPQIDVRRSEEPARLSDLADIDGAAGRSPRLLRRGIRDPGRQSSAERCSAEQQLYTGRSVFLGTPCGVPREGQGVPCTPCPLTNMCSRI